MPAGSRSAAATAISTAPLPPNAGERLAIWGLGTARHLLEPIEAGYTIRVLAIDLLPSQRPLARDIVMGLPSAVRAMRSGQLEVIIGDPASLMRHFRDFGEGGEQPIAPSMRVHLPSLENAPAPMRALARTIERLHVERSRPSLVQDRMRSNVRRNVQALASSPSMDTLAGVGRGLPAIVLAAGPSLDDALMQVRRAQGRCPIIAVDTAVRACVEAEISVDLICSVDPNPASMEHIRGYGGLESTILAFQPYAHPQLVEAFSRRVVALPQGDRLSGAVAEPLSLASVHAAGTVLIYAMQIAVALASVPIVLVGADFAHLRGQSHARSTASARAMSDCGRTIADTKGRPISTTSSLIRFHGETEAFAQERPGLVWSVDGGGAQLGHAKTLSPKLFDAWMGSLPTPVRHPILQDIAAPHSPPEILQRREQIIHEALDRLG